MNDQTFEEKASVRLSPLNIFIILGSTCFALVLITASLIAFTPLREYIPGYADVTMQKRIIDLANKADSLSYQMNAQALHIDNFHKVLMGEAGDIDFLENAPQNATFDTITKLIKSSEDSALRAMIEAQDKYDLSFDSQEAKKIKRAQHLFFTPLKGTLTSKFNPAEKHYGVDIVSKPDDVIKCTLNGTVIFADYTSETGYVIGVQHSGDLFSVYKHNSAILKNVGDFVQAGQVIAIIGNSGEYTTGPHLHFELWSKGNPVDPLQYMTF
ncbi:MAG: M23 family metallopeptidase [Bacteroidia bacterium]|nr:M23 family metallopeptidase [Bacteroidia bacterium]